MCKRVGSRQRADKGRRTGGRQQQQLRVGRRQGAKGGGRGAGPAGGSLVVHRAPLHIYCLAAGAGGAIQVEHTAVGQPHHDAQLVSAGAATLCELHLRLQQEQEGRAQSEGRQGWQSMPSAACTHAHTPQQAPRAGAVASAGAPCPHLRRPAAGSHHRQQQRHRLGGAPIDAAAHAALGDGRHDLHAAAHLLPQLAAVLNHAGGAVLRAGKQRGAALTACPMPACLPLMGPGLRSQACLLPQQCQQPPGSPAPLT